ncbi:MAG: TMEM175 family protein [Caulobacterales bacterium]
MSDLLDAHDSLEHRWRRHWYDRLMMLADGVFAIAITFLAADITTQTGWTGDLGALWAHLGRELNSYATSFVVISIYWLAHRRFMATIIRVDAAITVLTLLVLSLIVLLPPATRLINAYGQYAAAREVYGGLVIAIGAMLGVLWGYASLIDNAVSPEVGKWARWFAFVRMFLTPPLFLALVMTIPNTAPGVVPLALVGLFLIGWPMRVWVLRRIGGKAFMG